MAHIHGSGATAATAAAAVAAVIMFAAFAQCIYLFAFCFLSHAI